MTFPLDALALDRLSVRDRLDLIERIWNSLPERVEPQEIPEWHLTELAARCARAEKEPGDRLREDVRWKHGVPPTGNANYAWVRPMVHKLAPSGIAGFVLATDSMSSNQSGEGENRRQLVEQDMVDCMIKLPGQLLYTTQIPICLWFLARNKKNEKFRNRRGETLFIDARKLGVLEEITSRGHVLKPGRYVGAEETEDDDDVPFDERMEQLTAKLKGRFAESAKLEKAILKNLASLGFTGKESS